MLLHSLLVSAGHVIWQLFPNAFVKTALQGDEMSMLCLQLVLLPRRKSIIAALIKCCVTLRHMSPKSPKKFCS